MLAIIEEVALLEIEEAHGLLNLAQQLLDFLRDVAEHVALRLGVVVRDRAPEEQLDGRLDAEHRRVDKFGAQRGDGGVRAAPRELALLRALRPSKLLQDEARRDVAVAGGAGLRQEEGDALEAGGGEEERDEAPPRGAPVDAGVAAEEPEAEHRGGPDDHDHAVEAELHAARPGLDRCVP